MIKGSGMKQYNYAWSFGNTKLKKEGIVSFNIPALVSETGFKTCPNAGICGSLCYARQGRYTMSSVQAPRERNLARLLDTAANNEWAWLDVVCDLVDDIKRLPKRVKLIRVHDSGDYFDPIYMRAWLDVAQQCPDITFYCYTKMILDYQWYMSNGLIPLNMLMVQSVGGKQDSHIDPLLPHSRIFPTHADMLAAGYIDGTHTDKPAYSGARCIGLVYHGTRKLTQAQNDTLLDIQLTGSL